MSMKAPISLEHPRRDAVAGLYARPRTKRAFLQRPGDVCIVEARPDFTFLIKDAISPKGRQPLAGYGFLLGEGAETVHIDAVAKSFAKGSIPVLSQTTAAGDVTYTLASFCVGHTLRLRMTAANAHPAVPREAVLQFSTIQTSMGALYEHANEDYVPFTADARPWRNPLDARLHGGLLTVGGAVRARLVKAEGFDVRETPSGEGRLLTLRAALGPGQAAIAEWVVPYGKEPYNPKADASWEEAERETVAFYAAHLARGARLKTPDAAVNRLFDTLRLSSLQKLGAGPDAGMLYPGQGGMNSFGTVYGMESTCWVPVMDRLGYHAEADKVMNYLLTTQDGSPGPEGDVSDPAGSFRPHIHWMCETGAVLTLLCSHCLYTGSARRFKAMAPRLEAACRFIMRERARTKEKYAPGEAGHGLLPAGRPHDWPDFGQFLFSDAHTWKGLDLAARAFTAFSHPFATALKDEAEDYRRCILASFQKATHPHPHEPGRLWFSSEVHTPAGKEVGSYGGDGPICLVNAGLLDADDPVVAQIELDAVRRGIMTPLFAHVMDHMEDEGLAALQRRHAGGDYDLIYVTFSELVWYNTYIESAQRDKALAYLYSTLAYATTFDLGLTHERFCPQLPWLLPWQPNASANGRILEMLASTVCHCRGDALYLLAGAPEDWLESGCSLEGYSIAGGRVSVRARRAGNRLTVRATVSSALPGVLPAAVVYCLPVGWRPEGGGAEPVPGKAGWWRAPLAAANSMTFTR